MVVDLVKKRRKLVVLARKHTWSTCQPCRKRRGRKWLNWFQVFREMTDFLETWEITQNTQHIHSLLSSHLHVLLLLLPSFCTDTSYVSFRNSTLLYLTYHILMFAFKFSPLPLCVRSTPVSAWQQAKLFAVSYSQHIYFLCTIILTLTE